MAIYHLTADTGTRSGGQSARAKSDYINRDGEYKDKGDRLLFADSKNMPGWAKDEPSLYWSAADDHERSNARLFKQIEASLPRELTLEQNIALAQKFAAEVTRISDGKLPFSMAIHAGDGKQELPPDAPYPQPHLHLIISERINDDLNRGPDLWFKRAATGKDAQPENGGARKTKELMPKAWLENARVRWQELVNEALAEAGHDARIDHRTLKEQRDDALESGDYDKALELNRLPKDRVPREAHEFEERTGKKSIVRKEKESSRAEKMRDIVQFRRHVMALKQARTELVSALKELVVHMRTELKSIKNRFESAFKSAEKQARAKQQLDSSAAAAAARPAAAPSAAQASKTNQPMPSTTPAVAPSPAAAAQAATVKTPKISSSAAPRVGIDVTDEITAAAQRQIEERERLTSFADSIHAHADQMRADYEHRKQLVEQAKKQREQRELSEKMKALGHKAAAAASKQSNSSAPSAARRTDVADIKTGSDIENPLDKARRLREQDIKKLRDDIERYGSGKTKLTLDGMLSRALRCDDDKSIHQLIEAGSSIDAKHLNQCAATSTAQTFELLLAARGDMVNVSDLERMSSTLSTQAQSMIREHIERAKDIGYVDLEYRPQDAAKAPAASGPSSGPAGPAGPGF